MAIILISLVLALAGSVFFQTTDTNAQDEGNQSNTEQSEAQEFVTVSESKAAKYNACVGWRNFVLEFDNLSLTEKITKATKVVNLAASTADQEFHLNTKKWALAIALTDPVGYEKYGSAITDSCLASGEFVELSDIYNSLD